MRQQIKKTIRGMSMLYVIAALVVTGFIGTALIKVSSSGSMSRAYYATSATARSAAQSGIISAIEKLENDVPTTISILQKWLENPINPPETVVSNVLGELSYTAVLLAFDPENFNITLKSDGIGRGNSRASVISVYHLAGLEFRPDHDWEYMDALHIEDGVKITIRAPIEVYGGIRLSNTSSYDGFARGSVYHGPFRTQDGGGVMIFEGKHTFEENAYFGTPPLLYTSAVRPRTDDSRGQMIFEESSGFPNGVSGQGGGQYIFVDNQSYKLNKPGISYSRIRFYEPPITSPNKEAMLSSLGFKLKNPDVTVHPEVIPPTAIKRVSFLNPSLINAMEPTWHDFVVLETERSFSMGSGGGVDIDAGKKVILLVKHRIEMMANQKLFSVVVDETGDDDHPVNPLNSGHFSIIVMPGGKMNNIGGWEQFRGLYYRLDGKMIIGGSQNLGIKNLYGAVYAKNSGNNNVVEWYPQNNEAGVLIYDQTVFEDLDLQGEMVNGNRFFLTRSDDPAGGTEVGTKIVGSFINGKLLSQTM